MSRILRTTNVMADKVARGHFQKKKKKVARGARILASYVVKLKFAVNIV